VELKAIACDIDKTLTNDKMLLDLYAVETIRTLEAAGLPVILVTARDYMTAWTLSIFMGACGVVAAENGAVLVSNVVGGQPPIALGDMARVKRGLTVLQEAFGDKAVVYPTPGRLCSAVVKRTFDVEEGNAVLAKVGARLLDSSLAYHLVDADTGKGRGVREAAKLLGCEAENVVVIGDNFNDLEMFAVGGYSIAVGNAPQAVKDQVDYACSARFGEGFREGVKHALKRFSHPGIRSLP
jgi:phosphoglycolate phosphatase (TIGR01487 family)